MLHCQNLILHCEMAWRALVDQRVDMSEVRPANPLLSRYPLPMTEAEAKREGRRARRSQLELPNGHPYAAAPTWLPAQLAIAFERVRLALAGKRPVGRFVCTRAPSAR